MHRFSGDDLSGSFPDELLTSHRWVVANSDKIPYTPNIPPKAASTTDPTTWTDFQTAYQWVHEGLFPHLGYVLGDGIVGVDLDDCRDPDTGEIADWADRIISTVNSYTEISMSGTGVHILCRGSLPHGGRRKGSVEMYDGSRFFVMTGNVIVHHMGNRSAELSELHAATFGNPAEAGVTKLRSDSLFGDDDAVLRAARAARNADSFDRLWHGDKTGYASDSEADLALCRRLSFFAKGDSVQVDRLFRQSGLYRAKWDRDDYRNRTLTKASLKAVSSVQHSDAFSEDESPNDTPTAPKRSVATRLVSLAIENGADLFHVPSGECYATVTVAGHRETISLRSQQFGDFLAHAYFKTVNQAVTTSALKDAQMVLSAMAREGARQEVHVRVARTDDALWIDLGQPDWQAVRVTAEGWTVVRNPEVRFKRTEGLGPLPMPLPTTECLPTLLTKILNIDANENATLVAAWLVGALRGRAPYPLLVLNGEQGTAKTTATRIIRRIIDPNFSAHRGIPKEPRDLMIAARNAHVMAFDNLSHLPDWFSDACCTLATGGGFSTRRLHSDDGEMLFSAARPLIMNGITEFVTRPDLLDRALLVELTPIPDSRRQCESDLDAAFTSLHAAIFGALLNAVVVALREEHSTRLDRVPRMADFARWVTASEPALGLRPGAFLGAYDRNRKKATENALDGDFVVEEIRDLVAFKPFTGTVKSLLEQLPFSEQRPKTPKALGNVLRRQIPALRQVGVDVTFSRVNGKRLVSVAAAPLTPSIYTKRHDDPDENRAEMDAEDDDLQAWADESVGLTIQ